MKKIVYFLMFFSLSYSLLSKEIDKNHKTEKGELNYNFKIDKDFSK